MLVFITITFVIAWAFQTWRKRYYMRMYRMMLNPLVIMYAEEAAKIWADGYRDAQRTDAWPEELERRNEA